MKNKIIDTPIGELQNYTIRTYEIDRKKKATVPALIKLMHEAAMQNVIRIKLSVWDLEPHQIAWVLMRKYLNINRLPNLGEEIQVLTHAAGFEKFFTYRDYRIFDKTGEMIAHSCSTWLLMDTVKRRMTRIPDFIQEYNQQMPPQENCLPRPQFKIPKITEVHFQKEFKVGWFDLDFNGHLNNVFYTQWMLEALPNEVLDNKELLNFKIEYRIEGLLNEEIISEIEAMEDGSFLHRLRRISDEKDLALGQTFWK